MEMESTVSIPAKIRVHDCFCSVDGFDSGGLRKTSVLLIGKRSRERQGKKRARPCFHKLHKRVQSGTIALICR